MHLVKPCSTNSGVPSCGEVHAGDLWWAAKGRTVGRGCVPPHRKWGQGMGLCPSPELHAEKVIFGAYFVYVCYFLTTARWTDTLILCRKVTWDEHNPNASQYKTKFWFTWKHDSRKLIEMTFFCCKKNKILAARLQTGSLLQTDIHASTAILAARKRSTNSKLQRITSKW